MDIHGRRAASTSDLWAVLAILALALLVAGCGAGATTSAAVSAAPAPSALAAGTYQSGSFTPPVTFTLPEGWIVSGDSSEYLGLTPATSDIVGIHLFRSPAAASQDATCPIAAASGVGGTADDLVTWMGTLPGLVVGDPTPISLGGLAGSQVDVAIADGWTGSCPFANGLPAVPLFVSPTDPNFRWVVSGTERLRLTVLDVPGKGTVVVDVDVFDGSLMDQFIPAATPIVSSMGFGIS
jgi:hypothetical protein